MAADRKTITFRVASVVFFAGELGRFDIEPHADELEAKRAMVGAIIDLDRAAISINGFPARVLEVFTHVIAKDSIRATVTRDFFKYGAVVSIDFHD